MTLKDLLKKKEKAKADEQVPASTSATPEFTIMRTDTHTQEILTPPSFDADEPPSLGKDKLSISKRPSRFRSSSFASTASKDLRGERRHLSERLHLRSHSHGSSVSSVNVPIDLPDIEDDGTRNEEKEAQWEERATILAKGNPNVHPRPIPDEAPTNAMVDLSLQHDKLEGHRPTLSRTVSDAQGDENIQEAIRLHEAGDLYNSTAMFGRLADPNGANNALSQVLYGLALRHGWGIASDPSLAITYLSYAAANSASIESEALSAGAKKGGAAKGELVLAIYELANCFRHGWGVGKDPVAARSYYETAANLGDTDAMNEVARCYEEGFGGKKDKFAAAKYYRLAEQKGSKTLGNSWIWKEKYDPKEAK